MPSSTLPSPPPRASLSLQVSHVHPNSERRALRAPGFACFSSCVVPLCSEHVYSLRTRITHFLLLPLWHLVLERAEQVCAGDCFSDVWHLRCQDIGQHGKNLHWETDRASSPFVLLVSDIMTTGRLDPGCGHHLACCALVSHPQNGNRPFIHSSRNSH